MSFDIALSGIQAINEQLNTISNNIANAGTFGFKSSRANFASMYAGSQPTGTQIGSVSQSISLNGGVLNTGRSLDASINGRGFFVAKDATGQTTYTRVGIFNKDATDYLVDSAGRKVQGYSLTPPSTVLGPMGDIKVPTGLLPAKATTSIDFVANLSADWAAPTGTFTPADTSGATPVVPDPDSYNMSKVTLVHDSLGNEHTVTQYFIKDSTDPLQINVWISVDGNDLSVTTPPNNPSYVLLFNNKGQLDEASNPANAAGGPYTFTAAFGAAPAAAMSVKLDWTGTTMQKGESTTSTNRADGYAAGSYIGVDLADDGSVITKYSNGEKQTIGRVALATFPDEEALTPVNDTAWVANNNTGTPNYSEPGKGVAGSLSVTTLEQSNVDITSELVSLMTSQRNYQANSKVITTENQMLQSLMQAL
jgi:flagellar hook protein FlgE